ncbi:MAG: MFS transporter [Campylobacterales bacterium]|nr:MFS transporter [Campylobacterales bacterium]
MLKKVMPLSAILALRFLGLFLVLPVLSVYAISLERATPLLVGIIVGGYALTQALFQLPFGTMSDRIGRKVTLLIGLLIFLLGSVICALSDNIYLLMLGRFLQGAGAIGSVITAMISDLVSEEVRGKAMAIMGGTIALSFALAMGAGPIISAAWGTPMLFWITAALAVAAMILLFTKVPTPPRITHTYHETARTADIFKDPNLLTLIITNALQKGMMTVAFVLIPLILTAEPFSWSKSELWQVYVPAMVMGLLAMGPSVVFGEKRNKPKAIFLASIVLFIIAFALMGWSTTGWMFGIGVVAFFVGFNMMEPLVQSLISKFAKVHQKGAALGIANSAAYFATFIGGTFAGLMLEQSHKEGIAASMIILGIAWLLWTLRMSNPIRYAHLYLERSSVDMAKLEALEHAHIAEWYINETEEKVVIKFAKEQIEEEALKASLSKI